MEQDTQHVEIMDINSADEDDDDGIVTVKGEDFSEVFV